MRNQVSPDKSLWERHSAYAIALPKKKKKKRNLNQKSLHNDWPEVLKSAVTKDKD